MQLANYLFFKKISKCDFKSYKVLLGERYVLSQKAF
jgi:hypothetical protein